MSSKSSKSSLTKWYTSEIQNIMHGCGDGPKPMLESALLIEEVVHQQMVLLFYQGSQIAISRNSRLLGLEDILFLMRKNKVKLARLFKYLAIKDMRPACARTNIGDQDDSVEGLKNNLDNSLGSIDPKLQSTKRVKLCYDFLSSIDQTGDLLSAFDEDFFDEIKHERNLRIDRITTNMTQGQYFKYSEARKSNFANKARPNKFKEWLFKDYLQEIKVNSYALEILQYLAYETVAEIVDMALLVKQDRERKGDDPTICLISKNFYNKEYPHFSTSSHLSNNLKKNFANEEFSETNDTLKNLSFNGPAAKKLKKNDSKPTLEISSRHCIQPSDIREALRRYWQPKGPFSILERSMSRNYKLICL